MFKKKIFIFVLTFVLVFSMCGTVFADGKTAIVKVDDLTTEYYVSHADLDNALLHGTIISGLASLIPNIGRFLSVGASITGAILKIKDHGNGIIYREKRFPKIQFPLSLIFELPDYQELSLHSQ